MLLTESDQTGTGMGSKLSGNGGDGNFFDRNTRNIGLQKASPYYRFCNSQKYFDFVDLIFC